MNYGVGTNQYRSNFFQNQFGQQMTKQKEDGFTVNLNQQSDLLVEAVLGQKLTGETGNTTNIAPKNPGYMNEQLKEMIQRKPADPIAALADPDTGILIHEGVLLNVDFDKKEIVLGDMSHPDNVLSVYLSTGYTFKMNMDNMEDLGKVLELFTPEDVKRILQAIQTRNHLGEKEDEVEKLKDKVYEELDKNSMARAEEEERKTAEGTSRTESSIVVKPDGKKMLVVTSQAADGTIISHSIKIGEEQSADSGDNRTSTEDYDKNNSYKNKTSIEAYENNLR